MDLNSEIVSKERSYRILYVEDDASIRNLIKVLLKKEIYKLDMAENGKVGLDKFKNDKYDLVLMDIQMPVMDGITASKKMRSWEEENGRPPTPIVALTAHGLSQDENSSREAGCCAHLLKPIKKQVLLDAIHKYAKD